jgi:flagellin-like hook-associated protein FlgL
MNLSDSLSSQLTNAGILRAQQLNEVQSADPAQSITELTLSQTGYQATLAVGARIAHMSLLDYIS